VKTARTLALSSFLLSLSGAGLSACPTFAEEHGIDFWNFAAYHRELRESERERAAMDKENDSVLRRIDYKEEAIRDLLDSRISFEEAAERFDRSNRDASPASGYGIGNLGRTPIEKARWQVISYLNSGRGEAAAELAVKLEQQLRSELHSKF
jgi:hypothetical protein